MAFLNIEISKEVVKIESYEGKLQLHKLQKLQEKKKKKLFFCQEIHYSLALKKNILDK